jgi:D-amino peptidase
MRVLIMSDMEGVSGIVKWSQVNGGAPMYEEGRRLYTEEINAAVRGAKAAGATEVVAVDCHGAGGDWTFNSFVPELIDPDCTWVSGHPWSRYTEIFETGCDVALMIGMHARSGRRTACSVTRSRRRRGGTCTSTTPWWTNSGSTRRCAGTTACPWR